jgi:hypothetical protein
MFTSLNRRVSLIAIQLVLLLICASVIAEEGHSTVVKDAAGSGRFFALPVELDLDSGASNGDASILRIAPLYGKPSSREWTFVHVDLIVLADAPGGIPGQPGNPSPEPGERVFGLADMVHASFITAPTSGNLIWGVGGLVSIPLATDSKLGSGKWSGGPSFRIAYRKGPWNIGAFGGQMWSFAGDSDRSDVSQLIVRGAIRRQLPDNWYLVSAPIITANWRASGEKWLVPLGGGIGKTFRANRHPWAVSLQGYYNAIKPDGAPNWAVRIGVIAAIPFGD